MLPECAKSSLDSFALGGKLPQRPNRTHRPTEEDKEDISRHPVGAHNRYHRRIARPCLNHKDTLLGVVIRSTGITHRVDRSAGQLTEAFAGRFWVCIADVVYQIVAGPDGHSNSATTASGGHHRQLFTH